MSVRTLRSIWCGELIPYFSKQNVTLGTIDTTTASFKEKVFSNIAALRLLEVAGFKIGTASGTSHQLILSHSNPAVLTLVMQAS